MIVEYVRYDLPPDERARFESVYARVGPLLGASPHCLRWEVSRGVEAPSNYVVRIEWTSQDGHETGFRSSGDYRTFFDALSVFAPHRQNMAHFQPAVVGNETVS